MHGLARLVVVLLPLVALGGCFQQSALSTPPEPRCDFVSIPLAVDLPEGSEPNRADTLATQIRQRNGRLQPIPRDALEPELAQVVPSPPNEPPTSLFMSGGSLNGAFGAGFLDEWSTQSNASGQAGLPDFHTVTGISTGAILATFAFIDRTAPTVGENGYGLDHESRILDPFINSRRSKTDFRNLFRAVRHGALADLSRLNAALARELTDDVLNQVDARYHQGRQLLVGVVDVDTGQAVGLDLTEMAHRRRIEPARRDALLGCYTRAIVASSSAPLAALPVFIDNRMYVDGGVRFGTFSHEVLPGEKELSIAAGLPSNEQPHVFVIVNGDLLTDAQCGKLRRERERLCTDESPTGGTDGAHRRWNLPRLALRSNGILQDQVQIMSVERIGQASRLAGKRFHPVFMKPDVSKHPFTFQNHSRFSGTNDCAGWRNEDKARDRPVQFFPRYMHCLIDYGRARARVERWDRALNPPAAPAEPPTVGPKPNPPISPPVATKPAGN